MALVACRIGGEKVINSRENPVHFTGIAWAGGFLDNRILPLGTYGQILSAGAIPLIYTLIGLKVGAEFSSILESLEETEDA